MTYDFKPFFGEDSIRINPTILEKRWIKSLLNEDIVRLFLDENTIEKLNKKLIDIEPLFQLNLPNQNINKHMGHMGIFFIFYQNTINTTWRNSGLIT